MMLWTLLGILLAASTVQAQAVSDWDRFELFNACRPMMAVVEGLTPDAPGGRAYQGAHTACSGKPTAHGATLYGVK